MQSFLTIPFLQLGGGEGSDLYVTMLMFGGMFLIMYFFMIRPQVKKQKLEKTFQEEIKKGERVVTTAGIHGKIVDLVGDIVVVDTGAGKMRFEKSAISRELTDARYKAEVEE